MNNIVINGNGHMSRESFAACKSSVLGQFSLERLSFYSKSEFFLDLLRLIGHSFRECHLAGLTEVTTTDLKSAAELLCSRDSSPVICKYSGNRAFVASGLLATYDVEKDRGCLCLEIDGIFRTYALSYLELFIVANSIDLSVLTHVRDPLDGRNLLCRLRETDIKHVAATREQH